MKPGFVSDSLGGLPFEEMGQNCPMSWPKSCHTPHWVPRPRDLPREILSKIR